MNELLKMLGLHFPDGVPLALIPTIWTVTRDLADGDLHLSETSRAALGEAFEAYKRGEL